MPAKSFATSQRVRLTQRFVDQLQPPPEGRKILFLDVERRGFGLTVTRNSKSFIVIRRVPGHGQVRFKFGQAGELTVAAARAEAEQLLARMGAGENPVEQRRTRRAEAQREQARGITLRQAWQLREATLKVKGRSERTIEGERYALEKYLADWLDQELATITREEVHRKHQAIATGVARGRYKRDAWRRRGEGSGRATANTVLRAFRAAWNRAARQHPEIGLPPVQAIDWFPTAPKKAPIGLDGLAELHKRITAIENTTRRDLWTFMLFTGLRRKSACESRWADVDLKARTLRVPNPKGGERRAFTMPLPACLVDMLKRRIADHDKLCGSDEKMKPWVFPAHDSASGHVEEPRDDTLGVTPHDCRRLFLTVAEATDASRYAIKMLANHALPGDDVTAGYLQLDVERLRPVMEQIALRMQALCEPPPRGRNVVKMPARQAAR